MKSSASALISRARGASNRFVWASCLCSNRLSRAIIVTNPRYPFAHCAFRHFSSIKFAKTLEENKPLQDGPIYNWIDGAESFEKYEVGGYHPVMIGDKLHDRYQVVDKLGYGGWATTWLARDTKLNLYVAVKIGISGFLPEERRILRELTTAYEVTDRTSGRNLITIPLDEFQVEGPNGVHPCYTMAVAQGNLREAASSRLFPLHVSRALAAGLTRAVLYVHSRGYAHGDIHLRNVLVKSPPEFDILSIEELQEKYGKPELVPITRCDGGPLSRNVPQSAALSIPISKKAGDFELRDTQIILSDFGEAFSASSPRLGKDCHIPLAFRAPEAYFEPEAPLSLASDIWSLGRAIWDIIGMQAVVSSDFMSETEVVAQYIDVLGQMPSKWWDNWGKRSDHFDENQQRLNTRMACWTSMEHAFEAGVQSHRKDLNMGEFGEEETTAILKLMRQMLAYRPQDRPTAEEILHSEWMIKWAVPELERAKLHWHE